MQGFRPNIDMMTEALIASQRIAEAEKMDKCCMCGTPATEKCPRCRKSLCIKHGTPVEGKYTPGEYCKARRSDA